MEETTASMVQELRDRTNAPVIAARCVLDGSFEKNTNWYFDLEKCKYT